MNVKMLFNNHLFNILYNLISYFTRSDDNMEKISQMELMSRRNKTDPLYYGHFVSLSNKLNVCITLYIRVICRVVSMVTLRYPGF